MGFAICVLQFAIEKQSPDRFFFHCKSQIANRMPPAVQTDHLTYRYGERVALHELTISVAAGEIVALLGPNGSGKTTLCRILSTLVPPQEGRAAIFGLDLADAAQRDAIRRRIRVVFQNPALDKQLTAEENLIYHGHLYGLRGSELRQRVRELLGRVNLLDRAGERVSTFSGGMRRRVEVAKGLLHRPQFMLLDEPSTGLDPVARAEVWNYLNEVRQRDGVTVLLTTHLMDEADHCDRVAIMDAGRLIALNTPTALKERVGGDVITLTTRDAAAVRAVLKEKFGIDVDAAGTADATTIRFERPRGHEFIPALIEALPGLVESVSVGKPTLEDVFIHTTGRRFRE
ncbi:MAG: type transport system ATP-binding protein [Phycisphaerales bacterium]|nr:type transport system ATP-binding protein [Phycisphaerales bacterium]